MTSPTSSASPRAPKRPVRQRHADQGAAADEAQLRPRAGIPVSAALSGSDIYDGKLELSANLIAALVEAHPHYAYAIVQARDARCELEFFKDGHSLGRARYGRADATRAGLAEPSSTACIRATCSSRAR